MINVTQPYLPNEEKYLSYVKGIFKSKWLTNNGLLVQELERRLAEHLGVRHLILVSSGSMALQVSYRALDLTGEVITTPFTFVATANTLLWQNCNPVFSDIDSNTFNLDPNLIENKINERTTAIVPVHVFGNPCDVDKIAEISKKNNLPVIYDASHAFGVNYKGRSLLNYGSISTLSFHATKLFHTIEGGAIITSDDKLAFKIRKLINFGFEAKYNIKSEGINGKMNEFQAAMGLCLLDELDIIRRERQAIWTYYMASLSGLVTFQYSSKNSNNNHSFVPVLFENEKTVENVEKALNDKNIFPRRYFYPSLDCLEHMESINAFPISRYIASRILCLPIYPGLLKSEQDLIISIIKNCI